MTDLDKTITYFYFLYSMCPSVDEMAKRLLPKEKPLRKCALRGCENMTRHNGSYCCAEHCKAAKLPAAPDAAGSRCDNTSR